MEHEIESPPFLIKAGGDLRVSHFIGVETAH